MLEKVADLITKLLNLEKLDLVRLIKKKKTLKVQKNSVSKNVQKKVGAHRYSCKKIDFFNLTIFQNIPIVLHNIILIEYLHIVEHSNGLVN